MIDQKTTSGQTARGKFLTFVLSKEEYGVQIEKVHEIIGLMPITPVPQTPEFIRGIINLRGEVIPVVDLKMKFAMGEAQQTTQACIIVLTLSERRLGIMVDQVSEVLNINQEDIVPPPNFGEGRNTNFILGIGKGNGKVRILLDIETALADCSNSSLPSLASV